MSSFVDIASSAPAVASQPSEVTNALIEGATTAKDQSLSPHVTATDPTTTKSALKISATEVKSTETRDEKENDAPASTTKPTSATADGAEKKTTANEPVKSANKPLSSANLVNGAVKRVEAGVLKRKADDVDASDSISAQRVVKRARVKPIAQPTDRITRGMKAKVEDVSKKVSDTNKNKDDAVATVEDEKAPETTQVLAKGVRRSARATTRSKSDALISKKSKSAVKASTKKKDAAAKVPTQLTFRIIIPSAAWLEAAGNVVTGARDSTKNATATSSDCVAAASPAVGESSAATEKKVVVEKKDKKAKKASKNKVGGGKRGKAAA